jgi:glucosylceramidase
MQENNFKWISTTEENQWQKQDAVFSKPCLDTLELTSERYQEIDGFGGCFNELGWVAMTDLNEIDHQKVMEDLFKPEDSCNFNFCRIPIGASDYALEWYSHDEHDGDYNMEQFSIERDKLYLLKYIKEAQKYNPDIKFFASPWSPPTWMKSPKAYNYGTLIWKKEVLEAYALYFMKFIQAYEAEGVTINQLHVQNEPVSDQKFPSCIWTGEQFREFISKYLGPLFEKNDIKTEIWLGTLNGPEVDERYIHTRYDDYANLVLSDPEARKYIKGVSYQWCGRNAIQQTYQSFPEMKFMQSENECGDGTNTWEYARYVFNLYRHYLTNGVNSYIYWNMVLRPRGISTWGWEQNAMITVDPKTGEYVKNPEYYVMKHFSHFIKKGAVRVGLKGHWTGTSVAFENPNGEIVAVINNGLNREREITIKYKTGEFTVSLKPLSFNTIVISE